MRVIPRQIDQQIWQIFRRLAEFRVLRDVAKRDAWVETGKRTDGTPATRKTEMTFVNESGLYSLIFGSRMG